MYVIEANGISKSFGIREVIHIEQLKVEAGRRIGIVGANGAGKTTLLRLLGRQLEPDAGLVHLHVPAVFWSQMEPPEIKELLPEMASRFNVPVFWRENLSGGEKTRYRAAAAFQNPAPLMLVDEPTTNLDMEGIEQLEQFFDHYKGTLLLISHDRRLLDTLCTDILEVEAGKISSYKGNYSDYAAQKEAERSRDQSAYEAYRQEKKRLKKTIQQTKEKSAGIRKTPRRMGNSEARLHKMGNQSAKKNLDQAANRLKTKLEQLEIKEKPLRLTSMQLHFEGTKSLHKQEVVRVEGLTFAYGEHLLFQNAAFRLMKNSRTALVGPNGCGKSTLVRLLLEGHPAVQVAEKATIGYFDQQMHILDDEKTILENVMAAAQLPETGARMLLAKLLFPGDRVHQQVKVLSGGEKVKVSLAKILLQGFNLLLLDEPTNHLDIPSMEAVEEALKAFEGTLLLISHDRHLISQVAEHLLVVENRKINSYSGTYEAYQQQQAKGQSQDVEQHQKQNQERGDEQEQAMQQREEQLLVLENRKNHLIGRLSLPAPDDDVAALDDAYMKVLKAIRELKEAISGSR
ncbi:ribosomal protection-like ABC-F family protein [Anoxynatronum buryatiense]|uniref:Macrolide transport system ATP-binding/permease protein n=1 Tax=Anoxynatronum buryatiense TaxID=489973 RepID=A0AA46AJP3_9CLOT|nr:ABC-F type ribosomal protection protein [Anoxynatronum buryatiense]SMP63412.1 macrolide transport system ATP-binding/permease protein [Anoxynatronum buryatiense]